MHHCGCVLQFASVHVRLHTQPSEALLDIRDLQCSEAVRLAERAASIPPVNHNILAIHEYFSSKDIG